MSNANVGESPRTLQANSATAPAIIYFSPYEAQMVRGAIQTQIQGMGPVHPALAKIGRILNLPVTDAEQEAYRGGGQAQPFSIIASFPEPTEPIVGEADSMRRGAVESITGTVHDEVLRTLDAWFKRGECWDSQDAHFTMLTCSPAFRPFIERALQLDNSTEDPFWNLAWFATAMWSGGVLAARREFGRRPADTTDMELDLANAVHLPEAQRLPTVVVDPAARVEAELMARAVQHAGQNPADTPALARLLGVGVDVIGGGM